MIQKVAAMLACLILAGAVLSPVAAQTGDEKTAVTVVEEAKKKVSENPQIVMETSKGILVIELFPKQAPITVENFLRYVREGFYDGTIFHRVIPGFVIQGGGFAPDMEQKKTHEPIKNEADNGLKNKRGTLSMARTMVVDSATSQFFVNLKDNVTLDHKDKSDRGYGYAVFARVTEGMDVVDEIAKVPTGRAGRHADVPKEPIVVQKAYVVGEETGEKAAEETKEGEKAK